MRSPPPDRNQTPTFVVELDLVEIVYSDDGQVRVSITRDRRGIYRVHPERWDVSDFAVAGQAGWTQWASGATFTDDIEIARAVARESLRITPRSPARP